MQVFVFDILAGGDAVGDIKVDEFGGEGHDGGESIDHFHGVEGHLHIDERREVLVLGRGRHELEEAFDGDHGVVFDQFGLFFVGYR